MSSAQKDFEDAQAEYYQLLLRYEAAVKEDDGSAAAVFDQARGVWERVCSLAPTAQPVEDAREVHTMMVFQHLVGVGLAEQAKRLYETMSPQCRETVDRSERRSPGLIKIWLPKPTSP